MAENMVNIDCGDTLTIIQTPELYAKLLEVLAEAQPVEVNISKLVRIDMTGMQMLYAFSKESVGLLKHLITWTQPSIAFDEAGKLLGIPSEWFRPD